MTHSVEQIAYKAHIRQIRERLNAIEEMRDAKRLSLAGKSPREIAEILNTTQPHTGCCGAPGRWMRARHPKS